MFPSTFPVFRPVTFACLLVFVAVPGSESSAFKGPTGICAPQPDSFGIGGRVTCTFKKVVDIDSQRIPPAIPSVRCKCPGSLCSSLGDYRCVEVTDSLQVSYRSPTSPTSLVNKTIDLTTSCVCAATRSARAKDEGVFRTENDPNEDGFNGFNVL